jgi:spore coat protein JB
MNNNMSMNMNNNNVNDCNYEPTGINAQFGYNQSSLYNNNNDMCSCNQNEEVREKLMTEIRELTFAITDLGEYLNTHSEDERAICLHKEYCNRLRNLKEKYQKVYGPLSIYYPCNSWRWLEEPWPWEGCEE